MSNPSRNIQTKIQAANVLRHELDTLKSERKVYVQQPGSLVFFKSDKESALRTCNETLKSLKREQEQLHNNNMDTTS